MITSYSFADEKWIEDFDYAVAPHTKAAAKFELGCGILENKFNEDIDEYDYVSVISKTTYPSGTKIRTRCSFSGDGAPLLVFSNDLTERGNSLLYGLHFEIVVYKGGVNVWHIVPKPERALRPINPTKILKAEFPIADGTDVPLEVEITRGAIRINVLDKSYLVENEEIPESFRVGLTACEGYCRFDELEIEG